MIAEQQVHPASSGGSLFFQLHDEVHDFAGIGAPVQQVSGDYQVTVTSGPVTLFVDYLGVDKRAHHGFIRTMGIADGDDSRHILPGILLRRGIKCREGNCEQAQAGSDSQRLVQE